MAKQRLTDAQLRNQRSQALRALRRIERRLDTKLEVMERRLDRAIENKERITIRLMDSINEDFKQLVEITNEMQYGVADTIQIFLG